MRRLRRHTISSTAAYADTKLVAAVDAALRGLNQPTESCTSMAETLKKLVERLEMLEAATQKPVKYAAGVGDREKQKKNAERLCLNCGRPAILPVSVIHHHLGGAREKRSPRPTN